MKIIPALDLHNGQSKYPFNNSVEPKEIVKQLQHYGIHRLLITDLDGVFNGRFVHIDLVKEIIDLGIDVIASGGIRTIKDATNLLEIGVKYILVGTLAMKDQETLIELIEITNHHTMVSIDTFENSVYVEGWIEEGDVSPTEFVQSTHLLGIQQFVHSKINQNDDLSILKDLWCNNIKNKEQIHIIPVIDLTKPLDINPLIGSSYNEIIIGGNLDFFDWEAYLALHL